MAKLNINGKVIDVQVEPDTPLLWVIREQAGLTGTKYGCGVAQCGACSVHINGTLQRSCAMPVSAVKPNDRIVTIEGLSRTSSHPVQKAWAQLDVPQCGYCQSGQIMSAVALLSVLPSPGDDESAIMASESVRLFVERAQSIVDQPELHVVGYQPIDHVGVLFC